MIGKLNLYQCKDEIYIHQTKYTEKEILSYGLQTNVKNLYFH